MYFSVFTFISASSFLLFSVFVLATCHICTSFFACCLCCLSHIMFHSTVLALFTAFPFTFTSTYCAPSIVILSCSIYLFNMLCFAFTALALSTSTLQFPSSIFHLSSHHIPVTLDVFHFSSFSPNFSSFLSLMFFSVCIFLLVYQLVYLLSFNSLFHLPLFVNGSENLWNVW